MLHVCSTSSTNPHRHCKCCKSAAQVLDIAADQLHRCSEVAALQIYCTRDAHPVQKLCKFARGRSNQQLRRCCSELLFKADILRCCSKMLFEDTVRRYCSKMLFEDACPDSISLCSTALCSALLRAWICTGSH